MSQLTDLAGAWPLFAMAIGFFLLFCVADVAIGLVQGWRRNRRIRYRLESFDSLDEARAAEAWRRRR